MPKTHHPDKPKSSALDRELRTHTRKISRVSDLLSRQPALQAREARAGVQESWTLWLREQLPAELRPCLVAAEPRRDVLVIHASSAAWSLRLRYALAGTLAACTARDPVIRSISVRVRPPGGVASKRC
jgi:hypothetical protein